MTLRKKNATPGMVRSYEILRRLYLGDKTVNDLVSEINNIPRKTIVQDLGKLLTKRAIKKIKFSEERLELTENQIAKDFVSVKDIQFIKYHLTEYGKKKLAYYDWKYSLYTQVKFPWDDAYNQNYYDEMNSLIKGVMHLV